MKLFNKSTLKSAATTAAHTTLLTASLAAVGYLFFQEIKESPKNLEEHLKRPVIPK